ncbi:hypothetical protein B9Z19DRAFT_1189809 [Tuber borchii]|uniref:CCHC-type domain-containing protein n=1 Tax=Tuber borchii TaxID=42251 RepID=A0A2T7A636_TUBBO|nr:hypothetical protein B9Z19DRAFT_1189809 [Tuber borchii]
MERNYTTAVRAINADSRKRHRLQPQVVIPCPPRKPDGDSEDFISLNFESENEDEKDDSDEDDYDKEDNGGSPPSEDLKTTHTSMSGEDKENESEDGISEKTRSKKRRKDRPDRKDSAVGEREVGEEAMKAVAVARSEELVAALQSIHKTIPAVTIEIKSSPSSSSGGAYRHEADEDKDSVTRKAQQRQQEQQELKSAAAPFSSFSAITATGPPSLPSSARTRAAGTNTSEISSPGPRSQPVAIKTTAEILQGGKDLPPKAQRKLAKSLRRRERRRVERTSRKAALEQKKAPIGHPRGDSFGSVSSDVNEVEEFEDEGLEINLAQEEGGHIRVKEEEEDDEEKGEGEEGEEEEENYISLSITKAPVLATSERSILPLSSSSLSSSSSPSPAPAPYNKNNNSDRQDKLRQSPIPIDHKTVMFQLRYHSTSTPPPFIHEESRSLFASTNGITTASFRVDTKRFEELEGADKGVTMETIVCDICLCVGHPKWTCRLLKCEHCGAWDKHFSNACPELPTGEIPLKDYNWRKLPRTAPSSSSPTTATVALRPIKANCYNCSGTEHFGDDCPFLPPLSHPGIFSLSGVNEGDYASQEWLCEKQDLLAELEGKKKKPVYGRAVRPGDYNASEEFEPFREYRALEREKDRSRRKDTDGRGEMMMGRRRPGERSPPPRPPRHRGEYSEFDRYRDRNGDRERDRDRERSNRRSRSPPVRRATDTYHPSSSTSGPSTRYGDRGGGEYSRPPPPPPSIPPPPPPPPPPPSTKARHPIPSRPPATQNQARRGGAGRGGNSAGIGRGGGGGGRGSSSSSSGKRGGGGRGPK